eukprot:m.180387 g.180387  ORF g.180387 m.180387 type:complete len:233 (-) comp14990_c0_seq1:201-899(-)
MMEDGENEPVPQSPERAVDPHTVPKSPPTSPMTDEKRRNSLQMQMDTVKVQIKALRDELKVKEAHLLILQKEAKKLDGPEETATEKLKLKLAKSAQSTKATLSSVSQKIVLASQASKEKIVQAYRERSKSKTEDPNEETTNDKESEKGSNASTTAADGNTETKEGRSRSFTERMKSAGDSFKASIKRATAKKTPEEESEDEGPTPPADSTTQDTDKTEVTEGEAVVPSADDK